MYKGVVKIIRFYDNNNHHSTNNNKDAKIQITDLRYKGKAIEYAVKMKQIPQRLRMDNLVAANKVSLRTIQKLAHILVKFHRATRTNTYYQAFWTAQFHESKSA
jgi:aminoglycoside phosphotransferase family enzyme